MGSDFNKIFQTYKKVERIPTLLKTATLTEGAGACLCPLMAHACVPRRHAQGHMCRGTAVLPRSALHFPDRLCGQVLHGLIRIPVVFHQAALDFCLQYFVVSLGAAMNFKKNDCICFWLCWVFAAVRAPLWLWCAGLSLCWPLLLQSTASRPLGRGLQQWRLLGSRAQAQ